VSSTEPTAAHSNNMPIAGRQASDKKVAEADQPAKRPSLDFYARLRNKEVKVKTTSGNQIVGTLIAFSPYDLLIEIAGGEQIILPKHAIAFTTSPALKKREEEGAA